MRHWILAGFLALVGTVAAWAGDVEDFRLTTEDGLGLAARFAEADIDPDTGAVGPRPTIILIHGAGVSMERWEQVALVADLNAAGWHALSIDLRGRGRSEAPPESAAPVLPWADITAAFEWASADERVDADRIALVGESFGANLIVTGQRQGLWPVRTIVSLSATRVVFLWPVEISAHLSDALYVGSTGDPYPAVDAVARVLEALTQGETASIVADERSHGVGVLMNPETRAGVMDWLRARLDEPAVDPMPTP